MKRYEDARDLMKNKADTLAVDLLKAHAELQLHLETLEKVQGWTAKAMQGLHLTPLPLQDRSIGSLSIFFRDLSGQLVGLLKVMTARARREGRQIIDAVARLILPRVRQLAPDFPFEALLDEFDTPEEENEATAAIEPVIDKVKKAAKRE